ncbi:hypothetical protein KUTeg_000526 [Tegillarca granosa]|uniref:Metalloendopeptidase n=1 Tax=Tegillarca granosa TaxID=220873 RepID=A0ABQ9FXU7_TEGGR|nr:hypothetical protein KUTeg_000526 [Tegillarca granosa]
MDMVAVLKSVQYENIGILFLCHSSIGRDGGEQVLVLGDNCFYKGVIIHELNHAAGFFHEQSRFDRDKYVQVNWENVQDGKQDDFAKQSPTILSLLGTTYDYGSIMHYGAKTFSKNGNPVLTPRYDPHGLMGQRNGFSKLDIWKLNYMYGCVKDKFCSQALNLV